MVRNCIQNFNIKLNYFFSSNTYMQSTQFSHSPKMPVFHVKLGIAFKWMWIFVVVAHYDRLFYPITFWVLWVAVWTKYCLHFVRDSNFINANWCDAKKFKSDTTNWPANCADFGVWWAPSTAQGLYWKTSTLTYWKFYVILNKAQKFECTSLGGFES